jgi:hypothetical protein
MGDVIARLVRAIQVYSCHTNPYIPGSFIDIGRPSRAFPVTPPCVRVRTRRFGWLSVSQVDLFDTGLSVSCDALGISVPSPAGLGASPLPPVGKASSSWVVFCRHMSMSHTAFLPLHLTPCGDRSGLRYALDGMPTMPSADFCGAIRKLLNFLSPLGTRRRSSEVSPTAFAAHLPDIQP